MLRIISTLRVSAQRSLMMLGEKSNVCRPLASDVRHQDRRSFCNSLPSLQKKMISVTFVNREGNSMLVKAKVGDTFLDAAINNDVDLEGFGACEGTLSCSTCHIIFKKEDFDKLPDKPSDEEMDMLDLAYGLCDTSRLGCQITLTESMDGIVVTVPAQVADARNR
ncbi:adrenodoxin-like protein 2, mitochondrial [Daphnia carinata]|uniref:adrenodoxin-like protein 2, mitochondrial n=1 Tax=Daphnia carinata TaxID=120202 RepID=UPI00257A4B55|nr:adrenodoxin-like protein 2, mitochondrial [Daphnia carinata]